MEENIVVWFEIPVKDLKRAMAFYAKVLGIELEMSEVNESKMAFFPYSPGSASGALVENGENSPSEKGTIVYLNGGLDLNDPLSRVQEAGGKVLQEKRSIGQYGYIAFFRDTEGNRVALHSMK